MRALRCPLLAFVVLLALGCGDPAPATSSSASASSAARQARPDRDAFLLGRKLAFANNFEMLDAKAKMDKAYGEAGALAKALGIEAPTTFSTHDSVATTIAKQHGDQAAAAFSLGYDITFAWTGAELGADESTSLPRIEKHARAANLPEAVWKARLDGLGPKPSAQGIDALEKDIETHYRR